MFVRLGTGSIFSVILHYSNRTVSGRAMSTCVVLSIIEMILKFATLKREIGIESQKVCEQVRDQILWYGNRLKTQFKGCYRMEIISKAFAFPISIASSL